MKNKIAEQIRVLTNRMQLLTDTNEEVNKMPNITYIKTYGVIEGYHKGVKRFFARCDGRTLSLHYASYKKALIIAEKFCKSLYKDFIDFQGNNVHFEFKQEG